MTIKCPNCGKEMKIQVQATICAPSSLEGKFSKSNIRRRDVYLMGVNWETADYSCECGRCIGGYGNYVTRLRDAANVALGHLTGGMDGEWRNCDPIELLREALNQEG